MVRLPYPIRLVAFAGGATNLGTFGVAPFLAVLMVRAGFSVAEIGIVLGANLVVARCFPLFAGLLGDRTHHAELMVVGLATRSIGLSAFAFDTNFGWFVLCSALVGLGGALYEPNAYAVVAHHGDDAARARGYTVLNMAQNIGALAGPLLGGLLIAVNPRLLFQASSALMLVLAWLFRRERQALHTPQTDAPVLSSLGRVFGNPRFIRFGLAMAFFWFVDAQFHTSLPIYATQLTGRVALAGVVLAVNGVAGLVAALLLRRQFEKRRTLSLSACGFVVVALSTAAIPLLPALTWLLVCIAAYTLGETLIFVTADLYIAEIADESDAGAFFGGHDVFWAAGGTVGYFAGTALVESHARLGWLVFSAAALAGLLFMLRDVLAKRFAVPAIIRAPLVTAGEG
jgi:MFS family permease